MSVLPYYIEGLSALAETTGRDIPETALWAIEQTIERHPKNSYLSTDIKDIVDSAGAINPGDIYVLGLRGIAQVNKKLRQTAAEIQTHLEKTYAEEHIKPLWQAFNWLTGEKP